jgi:hypothetical protein
MGSQEGHESTVAAQRPGYTSLLPCIPARPRWRAFAPAMGRRRPVALRTAPIYLPGFNFRSSYGEE